jgi:hypothetical protein
MTPIQICALIGLIIGAALIYWTGYRGGLIDGRIEGIEEGINTCQAAQSDQQQQLDLLCHENRQLEKRYKLAKAAAKFGEADRQTLLAFAEQLRIAAETFRAFRTGKKLERDTITLRDQALAMATLMGPAAQEDAA